MATPKKQEFIIHVPKKDPLKRYSITRFNANLNIDISQWPNKDIHLRREDNRKVVENEAIVQDFGAGSEYGKAAREEARRKKYGRLARNYSIDKQPWLLDIKESESKTKKYKSIVERTGEHADYWIFVKQGNKFFAHKVSEWYQFLPQVQHKVLDIEQAEEQFQQRSRVMNQFALKAQIQQQVKDNEEDGGKTARTSNLLIKDKDVISTDEEDGDNDEDGDEDSKKKKKNKNSSRTPKNDKRVRVKDGDEVAAYESDDGDDEGVEFDYMSDSGSDSDRETKTVQEKVDEALVGVGDEKGLRNLIDDHDTDEDEEEDDEDINEEGKALAKKLNGQDDDGEEGQNRRDTDESEDEDPDATDITSPLLLQAKRQDERKRAAGADSDSTAAGASQPKKAKTEKAISSSQGSSSGATPTTTGSTSAVTEREQMNMLEDQIKRLLIRRPHTTKELLSLIRPQFERVEKTVLVNKLAEVLKVLGPNQFRKQQGKKEILYFSLEQK